MGARLLLGEEAGHHLLVDPGVVLGELVEPAVAEAVGAAVAHVRHGGDVAVEEEADDGRAHAVERAVLADGPQHLVMGDADRRLQDVRVPPEALVDAEGQVVSLSAALSMNSRMASTAICAATSPWLWPPMPSATT